MEKYKGGKIGKNWPGTNLPKKMVIIFQKHNGMIFILKQFNYSMKKSAN
jgi:hypothetical protein